MPPKEGQPKRLSADERLIRRYMYRIEKGDEVITQRIHSTLAIDSATKLSFAQVKDYVQLIKEEHARRNQ